MGQYDSYITPLEPHITNGTIVGIPISPATPTAEDYCNAADIDAVGFDLYCPAKGQSPPGATIVCTRNNTPGGCNTPPQCVDLSITGWYETNTPTACMGKSFMAETGYTTDNTSNPGSKDTPLYPDLTTMMNTYKTWVCTNEIHSLYFEWFDEDETNIGAANKFFGIYEWTTTEASQNYPSAKYQDNVSTLFSCP